MFLFAALAALDMTCFGLFAPWHCGVNLLYPRRWFNGAREYDVQRLVWELWITMNHCYGWETCCRCCSRLEIDRRTVRRWLERLYAGWHRTRQGRTMTADIFLAVLRKSFETMKLGTSLVILWNMQLWTHKDIEKHQKTQSFAEPSRFGFCDCWLPRRTFRAS